MRPVLDVPEKHLFEDMSESQTFEEQNTGGVETERYELTVAKYSVAFTRPLTGSGYSKAFAVL